MHSACTTHISNKPQIALARACHCFSTESSQIGLANSMYPCHSAVFNGCGTAGQALSIRHQALDAQTIWDKVCYRNNVYIPWQRHVFHSCVEVCIQQRRGKFCKSMQMIPSSRPYCNFFYWNKTDCWFLYAYVLVYASMYWYITVITLCNSIKQVCSSMQQYVLVHTINDIHCSSMYLYILVHTCTY